jgi:hypothetical protein
MSWYGESGSDWLTWEEKESRIGKDETLRAKSSLLGGWALFGMLLVLSLAAGVTF